MHPTWFQQVELKTVMPTMDGLINASCWASLTLSPSYKKIDAKSQIEQPGQEITTSR